MLLASFASVTLGQTPVAMQPPQVILYPPVSPPSAAHLAGSHQLAAETTTALPDGVRNQFLQSVLLESAFVPRTGGDNGLGITNINTEITFGLPAFLPPDRSIFTFSPGFEVNYLNGPAAVRLPGEVYRASTRFTLRGLVSQRFSYELSASPGLYSDLKVSETDGFRIPGHTAIRYQFHPDRYLFLGVAYLDREDITFVPVAGLAWNPNPNLQIEALFPKPRVRWKSHWSDSLLPGRDHWWYVRGEFGGGSWRFDSGGGVEETLTIREFRANLGWESLTKNRLDYRFELGYVFNRSVELTGANLELYPDDSVLLRASVAY